ncbi:hypothetical protein [Belnapia sp. F-4-1]|uniref:hypothetical protein n=1 Tax=Belnapia sp. F-4-1 TaxID=1545443 RepID=UPI0005B78AC6|nr:hypothetical protein [Belnapia sp. F-4-1]
MIGSGQLPVRLGCGLLRIPPERNPTDAHRVLKSVPQSDLAAVDPIWSSASVARNHGLMVFGMLHGMDAQPRMQPQVPEGQRRSSAGIQRQAFGDLPHGPTRQRRPRCVHRRTPTGFAIFRGVRRA